MRRLVAILVVAVAVIVVADLAAPAFARLEPGSAWAEPQTVGLDLQSFDPDWDDPGCAEPTGHEDEPCARRYAFGGGQTLTIWFSVRNAGPVPINLLGVPDAWIEQYQDSAPLARPVADLDGGDPRFGVPELVGVPYEPMRLSPGAERLIGVEFLVTDDVARACELRSAGGGIQWDQVPLAWSLIGFEHEHQRRLEAPVTFMAPTADDCG